jgi:hypothetical protein
VSTRITRLFSSTPSVLRGAPGAPSHRVSPVAHQPRAQEEPEVLPRRAPSWSPPDVRRQLRPEVSCRCSLSYEPFALMQSTHAYKASQAASDPRTREERPHSAGPGPPVRTVRVFNTLTSSVGSTHGDPARWQRLRGCCRGSEERPYAGRSGGNRSPPRAVHHRQRRPAAPTTPRH